MLKPPTDVAPTPASSAAAPEDKDAPKPVTVSFTDKCKYAPGGKPQPANNAKPAAPAQAPAPGQVAQK